MGQHWEQIIRSDDDVIEWDILDWADVRELWDENEEILSQYSIINDVLRKCNSVDITTEEYDFNFPGRSGLTYTIETNDSDLLRQEIREHIIELINPKPVEKFQRIDPKKISSIDQIIDYLMEQAAVLHSVREPAGYGGMGAQIARHLIAEAKALRAVDLEKHDVAERLRILLPHVRASGTRDGIQSIIEMLDQ